MRSVQGQRALLLALKMTGPRGTRKIRSSDVATNAIVTLLAQPAAEEPPRAFREVDGVAFAGFRRVLKQPPRVQKSVYSTTRAGWSSQKEALVASQEGLGRICDPFVVQSTCTVARCRL